ncbi:patched family-domain-containing protein [Pavlovales sp. CCMP2436]|nr:patched family-domain-containing protein [Pavlovales sp. CCMP2436]
MGGTLVSRGVDRLAERYGRLVSAYPYTTMAFAVCVGFLLATGNVTSRSFEARSSVLYVPQHAPLAKLRDDMWVTFGPPPDPYIVTISRADGGDILTRESLLGVMSLHEAIVNSTVQTAPQNSGSSAFGKPVAMPMRYEDVCMQRYIPEMGERVCAVSSILQLWEYDHASLEAATEAQVRTSVSAAYARHEIDLGGVRRVGNETAVGASALMLIYSLDMNLPSYDSGEMSTWELETWRNLRRTPLQSAAGRARPGALDAEESPAAEAAGDSGLEPFRINLYSRHINEFESEQFVEEDAYLMVLSIVSVIIYVCFALSMGSNGSGERGGRWWARLHRVALGLTCGVSVGFSVLAGFGLACYLGVPLCPVSPLVVFTLLGVSVDDMIILYDCHVREAARVDRIIGAHAHDAALALVGAAVVRRGRKERRAGFRAAIKPGLAVVDCAFAKSLAQASSAISLTSATTAIALATGWAVDFPVYAYFCGATGCCIACCFFFQGTLFAPLLLLSERAEYAHRVALQLVELETVDDGSFNSGARPWRPLAPSVHVVHVEALEAGSLSSAKPQLVGGELPQPPNGGYAPHALGNAHGWSARDQKAALGNGHGSGKVGGNGQRTEPAANGKSQPSSPTMSRRESQMALTSVAQRMMRAYAKWLLRPAVSVVVLFLYGLLVISCGVMSRSLKVGLPQRDTVPDGSHCGLFLDDLDNFWSGDTPEQVELVFKCDRISIEPDADSPAGSLLVGRSQAAVEGLWASGAVLRVTSNWADAYADWLKCPPDVLPGFAGGGSCSMRNLTAFLNDGEMHACAAQGAYAEWASKHEKRRKEQVPTTTNNNSNNKTHPRTNTYTLSTNTKTSRSSRKRRWRRQRRRRRARSRRRRGWIWKPSSAGGASPRRRSSRPTSSRCSKSLAASQPSPAQRRSPAASRGLTPRCARTTASGSTRSRAATRARTQPSVASRASATRSCASSAQPRAACAASTQTPGVAAPTPTTTRPPSSRSRAAVSSSRRMWCSAATQTRAPAPTSIAPCSRTPRPAACGGGSAGCSAPSQRSSRRSSPLRARPAPPCAARLARLRARVAPSRPSASLGAGHGGS